MFLCLDIAIHPRKIYCGKRQVHRYRALYRERYCNFFILLFNWNMIYGGKIAKTSQWDLKKSKIAKIVHF